eukprot:COSAG01_NODE_49274_length_373_cov_1.689781_1_plen_92_part_10
MSSSMRAVQQHRSLALLAKPVPCTSTMYELSSQPLTTHNMRSHIRHSGVLHFNSALYSTTAGRHNLNSCTHLSNMGHPRLAAHLPEPGLSEK